MDQNVDKQNHYFALDSFVQKSPTLKAWDQWWAFWGKGHLRKEVYHFARAGELERMGGDPRTHLIPV